MRVSRSLSLPVWLSVKVTPGAIWEAHARSCAGHQDLLLHEVKHRVAGGSSPGEVNAFLWGDHAEKFGDGGGACTGALLCVSGWVSFEQDALSPNFRL